MSGESRIRLAFVHWFPLEFYPPATNLLDTFSSEDSLDVLTLTSTNLKGRREYEKSSIQIKRFASPEANENPLVRLFRYAVFPVFGFLRLLVFRPDAILYIEPQSSFVVFIYAFFFRRCRILIHHHEYHDQHQFHRTGMRLVRFYHRFERRFLFPRADWISHTNQDRIKMFLEDHPKLDPSILRELPNYPPSSWQETRNRAWKQVTPVSPLRLVYVGSLSTDTTFIAEVLNWIAGAQDVELDVYSYNFSSEIPTLFDQTACDSIRFHSTGIDYNELPVLLSRYHVGLILYKGTTRNYVYNASNKLFEYLTLGLDVWYPKQMLGVKPFARDSVFPRVLEVDYEWLDELDLMRLRDRAGLTNAPPPPCCDDEIAKLLAAMGMTTSKC
jgi:hypothetical protein